MKEYMELYERNKKLDDFFNRKYRENDSKLYEKNCLELIVELGELANESKCFKYWSIKKPNMELVLEEYADCMLMCLYFFNEYDIDVIGLSDIELSDDILILFNEVIRMCTMLMNRDIVKHDLIRDIFTYILHIGEVLGLSKNEILMSCYNKIRKNEERLNSDY